MTNYRAKTRVGFTLVELLVVISIIAILAAISTGVFFRIRTSQLDTATEATMSKLNTSLDRRWRAVIDQAAEDSRTNRIPSEILSYAGNNKDRARTIWTYMLLKNEFPTTIVEATTGVTVNGYTLPARTVFTRQITTTGGTEVEQSAVCFYIAVTATGNRGEVTTGEGTNNQTSEIAIGGKNYSVYVDAWGKPIAFSRMSYSTEIDNLTKNPNLKDPLDQTPGTGINGQLLTPTGGWGTPQLNMFWNVIRMNHIGVAVAAPNASIPTPYENRNWVPTLISAGPNEDYGTNIADLDSVTATDPVTGLLGVNYDGTDNDNGADNVLSFRLRTEGARGN